MEKCSFTESKAQWAHTHVQHFTRCMVEEAKATIPAGESFRTVP